MTDDVDDGVSPRIQPARPLPLHRQVEGMLGAEITASAPGARLPSEHRLAEMFQVSRRTVRRALADLSARGLVERHRGSGTFVAARAASRSDAGD